jgi:hypothetical protein
MLAMSDHDAIRCERLDRRHSARVEKPLKAIQRALAFEHQPYNGALRRRPVRSQHRLGQYPAGSRVRGAFSN